MSSIKQNVWNYLNITFGVFLTSIGLKAFLIPNGFLDGGVTGISILLYSLCDIPISLSIIPLTIPFLIMGYFYISKKIAIKSIYSILVLALVLHFENFGVITNDKLLISIFGGIFVGAGIGIAIKNGAVLDGTEILGVFFNNRWGIPIGSTIIVFNLVLFLIAAILVSTETAMYSFLVYMVTGKVIDFIIKGFEDYIGVMIISVHHKDIELGIVEKIGAGLTTYTHIDGYGKKGKGENQRATHTIINRIHLNKLKQLIHSIDPDAFIVEYDVNKVYGGISSRFFNIKLKD